MGVSQGTCKTVLTHVLGKGAETSFGSGQEAGAPLNSDSSWELLFLGTGSSSAK